MNYKEKLEKMGIDYDEVMTRFAFQESLYMKFLIKFCEDSNYANLITAYEHQDYMEMERYAHTLKGTSANLGMKALSEACDIMVRDIRGNQELKKLGEDIKIIREVYSQIITQMKGD